jgi:hypothetical protein
VREQAFPQVALRFMIYGWQARGQAGQPVSPPRGTTDCEPDLFLAWEGFVAKRLDVEGAVMSVNEESTP